ncbi:MAG TPA: ABC transporter ATP-binding protein [Candidatus Scybalocola faecipullorum]|nr:ABC transporter ATP-binding protein [Candidatus Scybalocola faecipullorum]
MLIINDLTKYYGRLCALDHISMHIHDGDLYGFVGPNGAGKTTTLKILAGLILPDSGTVTMDGGNLFHHMQPKKSEIGYMPDFFGTYDNLKVIEYMRFFASIYDIGNYQANAVIEHLLKLFSLDDRKNQYVDTLSRGMKQKLCLARCLIHDPKLLLLDEPASGLDPASRYEVKEILKQLNQEGKTLIISSHILSELAEMCTKISIIQNGKIIADNTVTEIMELQAASKPLIINVGSGIQRAADLIKRCDYIRHLSYTEHEIRASFSGTQQEAAQLLKQLIDSGIEIYGFRQEKTSLESLFIRLTGKKEISNEDEKI